MAGQVFCDEFREEAERIGEVETQSFGWPIVLPGMAPLERRPAPVALTAAMLGSPCGGDDDLWALPVSSLSGRLVDVEQEFVAVSGPSIVSLPNGRTAFFAIASEGRYHAADAFGLIAIVEENQAASAQLFAMPGGGTWGEAGGFNLASSGSAIWSAAGDYSFGDAQGWAGVTDVSLSTPRSIGRFLTYGRHTCLAGDVTHEERCRGAWEYVISSIRYAPGDELILTWRLDAFDELHAGDGQEPQRLRQTTRELRAAYRIIGDSYRLISGDEPPRIE